MALLLICKMLPTKLAHFNEAYLRYWYWFISSMHCTDHSFDYCHLTVSNHFLMIFSLTFEMFTKCAIFQFLCNSVIILIAWNMGFVLAFASIVVPSVIGVCNDLNPDEFLHMTAEKTSWFGNWVERKKNKQIMKLLFKDFIRYFMKLVSILNKKKCVL